MYERPVRRIHQSDNSVVHMRRQIAGQVSDLIFLAEGRQFGRRWQRLCCSRSGSRVRGSAFARRHEYPDVAVALFAGIVSRKNAIDFQFVLAAERWNFHALPTARLKSPAVVTALQSLPIEAPIGQRNPAVR